MKKKVSNKYHSSINDTRKKKAKKKYVWVVIFGDWIAGFSTKRKAQGYLAKERYLEPPTIERVGIK